MSLLAKLLGREIALGRDQRARLRRWHALPAPDLRQTAASGRFIVTDVEASGLDPQVDRLIAIGAVTVEAGKIELGRSFYSVLRQSASSSRENILLHGIGGTEQCQGQEPAEALLDFLEFAGKAPLVGYHAAFDDAVIRRAVSEHLGERLRVHWIDLAQLAPQVLPNDARRRQALDDWLERFHIHVYRRHDALADALATAQLLLALMARAPHRESLRIASILWDASAGRWLGGR